MRISRHNLVKERAKEKKMIRVDGIQSSCGITYWVEKDEIRNHVYPDNDRSRGRLEPKKIVIAPRKRTHVPRYKEVEEEIASVTIIERQHAYRLLIESSY